MKRVFKRVLIASVATMMVALTAGIITSCGGGADAEDKLKQQGYSYCVTYDANGGSFGTNTTRTYAYVKENSLTAAPGYVDGKTQASIQLPTRSNYQLVGEADDDGDNETNDEAILSKSWFVAKTDEAGNVEYVGEGENRVPVLLSATPWDFMKDRVTQDITLIAQWEEVFRFVVYLTDTNKEGETVQTSLRTYTVDPGDTIVDRLYKKKDGEIVRRADYINVKATGYTLLDFYMDEACTQPLDSAYTHPGTREIQTTVKNPETGVDETVTVETNTVNLYVKYLSGKYDLISNENIRNLTESSNWYLLEDVDMNGKDMTALNSFTGKIYGNGFTLKNFKMTATVTKPTGSSKSYSIFGKMNGTIENLTMENVTMNVKTAYGTNVQGEHRVSFLATEFGQKASINGLTLKDCRILVIDSTCYVWEVLEANGGLWWTAPTAGTVNVTVKQNDEVVNAIEVVVE